MKYTIPKIFMGRPLEEWLRDEKKDLENRVKNPTTSDKSSLDDFILYAGYFTKDKEKGHALTLLDPKTGKYEVLARENDFIGTAIPVPRNIGERWFK